MALLYLDVPIQPDQRTAFDAGNFVEKFLPTSWNLQSGDRLN